MDLSPDWVVGFTDGEGCFHVSVVRNSKTTLGYQVIPEFVIVQHKRNIQILYALKRFFKCGVIRKNHEYRWALRIRKISCLKEICDFFTKHPLKTKKNVDFIRFRRIIHKMEEGRHLTPKGLIEIIDIALQMNTEKRTSLIEIKKEIINRFPEMGRGSG
jgi:hypothetical protein